jgi:hypothetical protein
VLLLFSECLAELLYLANAVLQVVDGISAAVWLMVRFTRRFFRTIRRVKSLWSDLGLV